MPYYKHGETKGRLHIIWRDMKQRCLNPNNIGFKNYGGRGITICPEWTDKEKGYINFRDWALSNGYADNLQIDRKNNDGNYEPNNCQWLTKIKNRLKQRRTKLSLKIANEIRELYIMEGWTQKQLVEKYNVCSATLSNIINNKIWKN